MTTSAENSDPPRDGWAVESHGRSFYIVRNPDGSKEYHRSEPCNYGPRGRIVSYRTEMAAQRKADELNRQTAANSAVSAPQSTTRRRA